METKENADTDRYFLSEKGKRGPKTSDASLASLPNRIDADRAREILAELAAAAPSPPDHSKEFAGWLGELRAGFSLLLYGVGSKRRLLRHFIDACLRNELTLEVDGFSEEASAKALLLAILEDVLGVSPGSRTLLEQARLAGTALQSAGLTLYLVVHNIDGPQLRAEKAIDALVALCAFDSVRLVCSVDHRHAQLLWHRGHLTNLRFLYKRVPTHALYLDEVAADCGLESQRTQQLQLSSLRHVMASLTANARSVLLLLAKRQLEQPAQPFPLDELYWACLDRMLVTSELTLQAHLKEFRDHKLVRLRSGGEAGDTVAIPLPSDTLTQFLLAYGEEADL